MGKPKRVLLVVRWPGGGIRTFIRYVYSNIDPLKWKLTIIAPESDGLELMRGDLADIGATFIPVSKMPTDGSSGAAIFFRQIVKEMIRGQYDLVHSHGFISGACSSFPAFINRLPHMMTPHEVTNKNQFHGLSGNLKKITLGCLFWFVDKIQSVSYDAHKNLIETFPNLHHPGKCVVIPNGIEIERFKDATVRDLRREMNLRENVFLIGFLGRFMAPKGFRYLIDAIDLLRNEPLQKKPLVLTFGDGCFGGRDKQLIREKGLEDYFCFMPFAPNVASTIKGLDVVAMPSLSEACGLVAMETLVCGTPIIGTDSVGLREVLRDTPADIIPKANASALAKSLIREMESPRKEAFIAFTGQAEQRFDVTKTKLSILQLYENLTTSSS
jgi:glycosyltransferase involved in cell wall biosynthesis